MTTTDKCQRLKDILQGKTLNAQRCDSEHNQTKEPEKPVSSRRRSTADRLKETLRKKEMNDAKVLRLKEILHKGSDESKEHQVQEQVRVVSSEPCVRANLPLSAGLVTDHAEQEKNENADKKQSATIERLRRILRKNPSREISQASKSCSIEASAVNVADPASRYDNGETFEKVQARNVETVNQEAVVNGVDYTPLEEDSRRLDKAVPVSEPGITSGSALEVIPTCENSTPEPQDCASQIQHRIAQRRLPLNIRTDVVVVGFRSNFLFVHETSILRELVNMMKSLQSAVAAGSQVVPQVKTYVAALRPEDNKWYRARVERERREDIEVFYIDYGNKGTVCVNHIRSLPESFLGIPSFAVSIRPEGVEEVNVDIFTCLQGQVIAVEAVECSKKRHIVKLYEKEGGNCINEILREMLELSKENLE